MPNRAPSELRWEEPAETGSGLSRAAIVAAALTLADRDGLDAVSIRRVAAELDTRPMSLYTHIASKDDLVDLMLDAVVGEVLVPEPLPQDWRDALRQIAVRTRATFLAHPWVLQAVGRRQRRSPSAEAHVRQSRAALAGLGLDDATAATVLAVVDEYTIGNALLERVRTTVAEPDPRRPDAFAIGLDALLDGLDRRLVDR